MQSSQMEVASRPDLIGTLPVADLRTSIATTRTNAARHMPLSREESLREAVLLCFSSSYLRSIDLLRTLSPPEWRRLLIWLDASGLALYFLDRITRLGVHTALPGDVIDRLGHNLEENRQRTQGLIGHSIELQYAFQSAGLCYAVMKGLSLYPQSVPNLELRHQFDIDFLVAESSAAMARQILERHGYTLYAISGKSWEFKTGQTPHVSAKDLYRDLPYRGVELHLEPFIPNQRMRLQRRVFREICAIPMAVLSPIDLFLGQAMHVFKDICSPFLRASHLLEFYRHVLALYEDADFWNELRARAQEDRRACYGIGVATYLAASVLGNFAPPALTSWTVDQLPAPIRLWLDLYGRRSVLQLPPGTKLHLLLRQELEVAGLAPHKTTEATLLPSRFPPAVIQATHGESSSMRLARYRVQMRFLASRLRFHVIEGFRFGMESRRWRRVRNRLS
jgi:Uncharacterised nucleotidyltransferase